MKLIRFVWGLFEWLFFIVTCAVIVAGLAGGIMFLIEVLNETV